MPKVTDAHRDAMRARIRDAALAEFARRGVRNTSMADILAAADLSAGALYGYYESKDALVVDVALHIIDGRRRRFRDLRAARPLPPPQEVVAALLQDGPGPVIDSGLVLQMWGEATTSPGIRDAVRRAMGGVRLELRQYLTDWFVASGLADGEARKRSELLAPALMGLAQGALVHRSLATPDDLDAYLRGVAAMLNGVARCGPDAAD